MNIAIIPARIGSKRIKNKNVKLFYNKPIIYWTIKILKKSQLFKSIVVTSNSEKILDKLLILSVRAQSRTLENASRLRSM